MASSVRGPRAGQQERRARAIALRQQGLTYTAIAKEIGCGHATAFNYVNTLPEKLEQLERQRRKQPDGSWRCSRCTESKPPAEFMGKRVRPYAWCRACRDAACKTDMLDHPDGMKTCRRCREAKPRDAFGPCKRGVFGLAARCRQCIRESTGRPDRVRKDGRTNLEAKQDERLRRLYGITLPDYRRMSAQQDGKCAICSSRFGEGRSAKAHVDHCHQTGMVRGLLCMPCNTALGGLTDDPRRLASAINYLQKAASQMPSNQPRLVRSVA